MIITTEKAMMVVTPTTIDSTVPCPVTRVELRSRSADLRVAVFERRHAERLAGIRPLTANVVKSLGLPTRSVEAVEVARLLVPAALDVEADPRHVDAAAKLATLPFDRSYQFPMTLPVESERKK